MARYVVELYRASSGGETLRRTVDRLHSSAVEMAAEGIPVRYLDTIFLPGDETCLHVFEAPSEADARALAERALIDVDRVVLAEQVDAPSTPSATSSKH